MGDALSDVKDKNYDKPLESTIGKGKFTCPVSMQVTQEQYEKNLKQELLDLGYFTNDDTACNFDKYLVTKVSGEPNAYSIHGEWAIHDRDRYFIDHYNPELFLALAAMREGDEIHVGEYVKLIKDSLVVGDSYFTKGDVLRITDVMLSFGGTFIEMAFVKATKEEIIDWLTEDEVTCEDKSYPGDPADSFKIEFHKGSWSPTEILEEVCKEINSSDTPSNPYKTITIHLFKQIEKLQKENDELKGVKRIREGELDSSLGWNGEHPRLKRKDDCWEVSTQGLEEANPKIFERPLTPDECFPHEGGNMYYAGMDPYDVANSTFENVKVFKKAGFKDSKEKLNYELDWEFIESMAKRMQKGGAKYEPYNWKKPLNPEELKQAMFRHMIEIMKGNYEDEGSDFGHIEAISCGAMMLNYQLKHNKTNE